VTKTDSKVVQLLGSLTSSFILPPRLRTPLNPITDVRHAYRTLRTQKSCYELAVKVMVAWPYFSVRAEKYSDHQQDAYCFCHLKMTNLAGKLRRWEMNKLINWCWNAGGELEPLPPPALLPVVPSPNSP